MQNNMNFMGGTPELENTTWYNPQTGDTVTVRNTFIEGNDLVIQTMDGRMMNYNQFSGYVQADAKQIQKMKAERMNQKANSPKQLNSPKLTENLEPAASLDEIDSKLNAEAMNLLAPQPVKQEAKPLGNIYAASTQVNLNYEIIQKALNDKPMPKCDVKISWKDCPLENIKALVDMFGINKDELVEYYNSRIDVNEIVEKVKKAILDMFTPEEKKEEKVVEKKEEKPVEKKPIKKEEKKSPKATKKVKKD